MQSFSELIDFHLEETSNPNQRVWRVSESEISGRGVFAVRDIQPGEIIFKEKPLLIGPNVSKDFNRIICSVCYKISNNIECVCPKGCSLPVCELCSDSKQHAGECDLFRSWQPVTPGKVSKSGLRLLVVARGLFLNETQKQLVYALQANEDPVYKKELVAASCDFQNFLREKKALEYLLRIICVLNTNAFEALQQGEEADTSLRGLYPLAGIMNHQCTPNTCHYFEDNNIMVVKSAKFIPKEAELTTTYTKILWSNQSRRVFLSMTKQFECSCSRCLDPTENGSYLSALLCRTNDCYGWIIPIDCSSLVSDWRCMKCGKSYNHKSISRTQELTLHVINAKTSSASVREMLQFIREKAARICPPTSQFIIEFKLNVIWKMTKTKEDYSKDNIRDAIQYCEEILGVLEKLEAGQCNLKRLLIEEINKFNEMLPTMKV